MNPGTEAIQETRAQHRPMGIADCSRWMVSLARQPVTSFHEVSASVHAICRAIEVAEGGDDMVAIAPALSAARELHARSTFVRRLQEWPLGYPGDFETIEYILRQDVDGRPGSFEYWIEYLALSSAMAQQHRNKVRRQAAELKARIATPDRPANILILAAGGAPDLRSIIHDVADTAFHVVLNDIDQRALSFAGGKLGPIADRTIAVPGNAVTNCRKLAARGPFDLVVAGGLMDYLPTKVATRFLTLIWKRLLGSGGVLFFTNIRTPNPWRIWPAYLANWSLLERSREEIEGLIAGCRPSQSCRIDLDATGLAWNVRIEKA